MKTCIVEGCEREHRARGLCGRHYYAAKARGEFTDLRPINRAACKVENCERDHYSRGLCRKHYTKLRESGTLEYLHGEYGRVAICTVEGCEERGLGSGLCRWHYDFRRRTGYDLSEHPELQALIQQVESYGLRVGSRRRV